MLAHVVVTVFDSYSAANCMLCLINNVNSSVVAASRFTEEGKAKVRSCLDLGGRLDVGNSNYKLKGDRYH